MDALTLLSQGLVQALQLTKQNSGTLCFSKAVLTARVTLMPAMGIKLVHNDLCCNRRTQWRHPHLDVEVGA